MVGNGNLGALMLDSEAAIYEKSKRKDGSWPPWDMLVRPSAVVEHGRASGTHCERPAGNHLPASDPASCNCGSSFSIGKRDPIHNKSRVGANVGWRESGNQSYDQRFADSPCPGRFGVFASASERHANFTLTCINFHIHLSVERIHAYLVLTPGFHVEIVMPFGITFGHLSCPASLGWKSADDVG
jgi:hypothetical protein